MYDKGRYTGRSKQSGITITMFSEDDVREIDYATRDVLSNYGVQVSDKTAIKVFEDHGCEVNYDTLMVKIPEFVLNKALAAAPSRFYMYGRDEKNTIENTHKGRVHYTNFGTGIQVCDYLGNNKFETRDSTDADLAKTAKIVDYLPNIDYYSLAVDRKSVV